MRRWSTRIPVICLAAVLLCLYAALPGRAEDVNNYPYTYNYDYWGKVREMPDAYRVEAILDANSLGLETDLNNPQSVFTAGDDLYVCDTGNNRILQIHRSGAEFNLVRIIDRAIGAEPESFNQPYDIFVDKVGTMYVCDQSNGRIVKMDKDCNYMMSFVRPTDETFDVSLSFLPTQAVVDASGRVFVICKNVNKGFVKYEADGTFSGFFGAMEVKYSWYDYIWKLLSTKAQRAQMISFVPTEYANICIDPKGFLYAVIASFEDTAVKETKPIRRINSVGNDILIRNSANSAIPQGDLDVGSIGDTIVSASRMADITVLDNGIYIGLDRIRGRMFGYDTQGNLLWAFGGSNSAEGYFGRAISMDHMGYDLFVLDNQTLNITVFTPTEYGRLIYQATEEYLHGYYEQSAETWEKVLTYNGNYDLAYVGIGRAQLRADQYEEAMKNFKTARDAKNYAEAFRLYRKEWVEQNVGWIIALIAVPPVLFLVIRRIKKVKAEVNAPWQF